MLSVNDPALQLPKSSDAAIQLPKSSWQVMTIIHIQDIHIQDIHVQIMRPLFQSECSLTINNTICNSGLAISTVKILLLVHYQLQKGLNMIMLSGFPCSASQTALR